MLKTHPARWAFLLLAGSLVAPLAARAARPAGEAEAEEAGDAPGVERDDPRARAAANREWRGVQGAERVRVLEEARRERDRYGVPQRTRPASAHYC